MQQRLLLVIVVFLLAIFSISPQTVSAQQDLISLNVDAGYDGYFRENYWTPLLISVTNNSDPIEGKLIARQERSQALTNTFSTPVSLASGARQTVLLYVTMRSFASSIQVELLDNTGAVVTDIEVPVRSVTARDKLYVVVTNALNSTIDLSTLATGGNQAFQANWLTANVPDKAAALESLDMLVFSDIDTGTLSTAQRSAIEEWVTAGGHLVVTGGANWQGTAAAFTDILPLTPQSSDAVEDLTGLAELAGDYSGALEESSIVTQGELREEAVVLASSTEDIPLVARREIGYGTIDYLTLDPSVEPLRGWDDAPQLWFTLLTSVDVRPGWAYGFTDMDKAIDGIEILPGYNALPEATSMIGFLILYIVLVGPVNYLVLRQINRRELAWVTIPVLILVFSALAWATGFNLRGTEVLLSRLSVVQSWSDASVAHAEQVIGLLAPRRANYTLGMNDDRLLRPVARAVQGGRLLGNTGSTIEVEQSNTFAALSFPVDASFIAGFSATSALEAPDISGRITLAYTPEGDQQTLRGTIRNDSELTLSSVVILARGVIQRLDEPLEPGDLYVLDEDALVLQTDGPVSATPIEYGFGTVFDSSSRYYGGYLDSVVTPDQSATDIIGQDRYQQYDLAYLPNTTPIDQETRRRQKFVNSFIKDQYNSTARGNNVYLIAWSDSVPYTENIGTSNARTVDSTLHIVELETDITVPANTDVVIGTDQFSWVAIERDGILDAAPTNLNVYSSGVASFRFTPLPDSRLDEVEELYLVLDQGGAGSRPRPNDFQLWNWGEEEWETVEIEEGKTLITESERFIGPLNAVQVRLSRDVSNSYMPIGRLGVEQRGRLD
jgi:hypothetical protein